MDNTIYYHLMLDQLEGRTNGPDNEFRWDGEGWVGTDMNKLWFKSEGFVEHGKMSDGDQEVLYDRPIPFMRFFDAQAGVRYDLDSNPGRAWGAIGIEGLAAYFFEFAPTFYFSDRDYFAGRIERSYDILITNRLIAQPQAELNFYTKNDRGRGVGSGLSEIDTGGPHPLRNQPKVCALYWIRVHGRVRQYEDFHSRRGRQSQRSTLHLRRPRLVLS